MSVASYPLIDALRSCVLELLSPILRSLRRPDRKLPKVAKQVRIQTSGSAADARKRARRFAMLVSPKYSLGDLTGALGAVVKMEIQAPKVRLHKRVGLAALSGDLRAIGLDASRARRRVLAQEPKLDVLEKKRVGADDQRAHAEIL